MTFKNTYTSENLSAYDIEDIRTLFKGENVNIILLDGTTVKSRIFNVLSTTSSPYTFRGFVLDDNTVCLKEHIRIIKAR